MFSKLKQHISRRGNLHVIENVIWLFMDKVLRLTLSVFVGVWMARYLGPHDYGTLNYAIAFVGIFGAIASLGLNNIVVKDLVSTPSDSSLILGTALRLQLSAGILVASLAILVSNYIRPDDITVQAVVLIVAFTLPVKASDVIRYAFEAHVKSKYIVLTENAVLILVSAARILLILNAEPLLYFASLIFVEALLTSALFLWIYKLRSPSGDSEWPWSLQCAKRLLKESWPLILSNLAVLIYMRIDQLMLGHLAGNEQVGIYSAAIRISEIWYIIPTIIVTSLFPGILRTRAQSHAIYLERLQAMYDILVIISLIAAIPMIFVASDVAILLFGKEYEDSGKVLLIHIWTGIFVFLGVASARWYVSEGLQIYLFYRSLLGAVANIALNSYMIPHYGAPGAALSTVVSQALSTYIFDSLNAKTRICFRMKTLAIFSSFFRLRALIAGFAK